MINKAIELTDDDNVLYSCSSLFDEDITNTSFITSYYAAFISPSVRQDAVDKIYKSLNWGGAFVMFEKVRAPDARFQDYMSQLYADYKVDNGYTPENIIQVKKFKEFLNLFRHREM